MKQVSVVNTPQSRCRAAVARCDITPPIGIYHRMSGAALQDQATGVHRPLEATLLWMEPHSPASGEPQVIVSLDHCILDAQDVHRIRDATLRLDDGRTGQRSGHGDAHAWRKAGCLALGVISPAAS